MSLARALTTRRKEVAAPMPSYIGRAASQRVGAKPIKRSEISLPVQLLSTTNMLSYEAPDIADAHHVQNMGGRYFSSANSVGSSAPSVSGDESDRAGSVHSHETDATSVDLSSPDLSADAYQKTFFREATPPLEHRSTVSSRISHSTSTSSRPSMDSESPRIPSRAPSHSKTAHVLSHKRSVQRMATVPSDKTTTQTRDSFDMFSKNVANTPAPASHPFGRELEQLNEAAEEFSYTVRNAEADADHAIMRKKGLVRICANEYLDEISSLYSTTFEEEHSMTYQPMIWI